MEKSGSLEVCIDSLESAVNAINGGASELEVCSSLAEGGLTPSPGLVVEILNIVKKIDRRSKKKCEETIDVENVPKVNIMIRCRGGSDFNYSAPEMDTMLADVRHYKTMGVDSFVFGALNGTRGIDKEQCSRIIAEAHPIPVTFHRAFDLCFDPNVAMKEIIELGFKRLLTSGQRQSAGDEDAIQLINNLQQRYGREIEIMPGSGVTIVNVKKFKDMGCKFFHSSCKVVKKVDDFENDLGMGVGKIYVSGEDIVRSMVQILS
ncbi:copper homeostasis protein cutC homolog [Zerene cesonia]|uniref:copper homeostasis protein cutC homolog n=1 Tax=Zerene cesonia TaxID=33412 RepID=UPI0018E5217C|nr:copper homeostasis protein cutC homolog [Zerene cesonia]XP_038207393.1 copper homeostasis protein cutC homolog [Zerene cesonia]XP_038207394.1 copper homeostasis protein cutC homolog [Zerene cesonia]XP_038207395.1 copper homeostasis protein cutC homolog [Zerene cesonia]